MKLARIILPTRDNAGFMLTLTHSQLRRELCSRYGGFTAVYAEGSWQNPQSRTIATEPVIVYEVAMERAAIVDFRHLAAEIAAKAHQECVMIVTPQGDVEFVKPALDSKQTVS